MTAAERIAALREMYGPGKSRHAEIEWLLSRLAAAERVVEAARNGSDDDWSDDENKSRLDAAIAAYDAESK